jgi:ATP adenylyltransferase
MAKPLWAPWRLEYIKQASEQSACVFCEEVTGALPESESLLIKSSDVAVAILNKYPYSSGHLMVAPSRHVGSLGELTDDEALEIHRLAVAASAFWVMSTARVASTSAGTSGTSQAQGSPTTCTSTSFLGGRVTRTSCQCSRM